MQTPLLLLHGALGSQDQLQPLAQILNQNHEVYSINFSGHGGRAKRPEGYTMAAFAQDVLDFMAEKGFSKINIFGYSMGGYVALYLARLHPDKVGQIFTLATKFDWNAESSAKEVKMLNPEKIEAKVPKFAQALQQRHAPLDWKTVLNDTATMMLALGGGDALTKEQFAEVQNKAHITVGEADNMVSQQETLNIAMALPNGNYELFEGFKHPIEKVDGAVLAAAINKFINNERVKE